MMGIVKCMCTRGHLSTYVLNVLCLLFLFRAKQGNDVARDREAHRTVTIPLLIYDVQP